MVCTALGVARELFEGTSGVFDATAANGSSGGAGVISMPLEAAMKNTRRPYTLVISVALSCIAVSSAPVVTGVVMITPSTEIPACWALSKASAQSPAISIGAAVQAQRSPPFNCAAAI
ncbi:hypothetical protein D3C84_714490 [compost metagenome]